MIGDVRDAEPEPGGDAEQHARAAPGSRSIRCDSDAAAARRRRAMPSKRIIPAEGVLGVGVRLPPPPVSVSRLSETATRPIPIHWRRPSSKPKKRSASTARKTRPPASTAWPIEIGASVSAADVQRERHRRHAPADAPPLRPEQIDGAAQRMAHVDVGRGDRALVLEQEREVRAQRGEQRTEQADADAERDAGHVGTVFWALSERRASPLLGSGARYAVSRVEASRRGLMRAGRDADMAITVIESALRRMGEVFGGEDSANGRSLAYVWGFGSTCLTATVLLPHPAAANVTGLVAIIVAGYLGAAVLFTWAAELSRMALETMTYLGQLLITGLTFFWGAPDAPFLWFHVWLVVHTFHFLPPARASRQIACAAVLYVFATVATHSALPAATSVVGVGTIVAVGMLVGAFRVRVDELLRESTRSAAIDPLTGLYNRRAFAEAYAGERARRARSGRTGALLLVDCDRFKALNDRDGHPAGDRALRRVAEVLAAHVRDVDTPRGSAATSSPCC